MFVLKTDAGLCNRMRAIDSAIAFCKKYNRSLDIVWELNNYLNCSFFDLFESIPNVRVIEGTHLECETDVLKTRQQQPTKVKSFTADSGKLKVLQASGYDFNNLNMYKRIYINSFIRFFTNPEQYQLFRPIESLSLAIDKETEKFTSNTIGLHIRRTDNKAAVRYSPIELFINAIECELKKDEKAKFYLASDSLSTKKFLAEKYKDAIITNLSPVNRDNTRGIQRALIELYALSRSQKVYGSYWSSFSHTACNISGIPEITIKATVE